MNRLLRLVAPLGLLACAPEGELAPTLDGSEQSVIYGADDRLDYYQLSSSSDLAIHDATVALFDTWQVSQNTNGTWDIATGSSLQSSQGVCSSEPFASQPTGAWCSGFLVGPDTVVTAGHCVSNSDCGSTAFVFNYRMNTAGSVNDPVAANDVYFCDSIISRSNSGSGDYSVIQLDRTVTGHAPFTVATGAPSVGESLILAGHPSGLPFKLAGGANVKSVSSAFFDANLDAYGGNSGSPVVNAVTGEVEGILVSGNPDYTWSGGCYVSNTCSNNGGCPGYETATRASTFVNAIPTGGGTGGNTCTDDAFEENDTQGSAVSIVAGSYAGNEICTFDDDWYAIDVPAGGTVTASITFSHADGDLDLALHDSAGTRVAVSQTVTDDESASANTQTATTGYIRVYGYQGAEGGYDLDVQITGASVPLTLAASNVSAGDLTQWFVSGGPANGSVQLLAARPGGSPNSVSGCPGLNLDLRGSVVQLTDILTDASGTGSYSRTAPSRLAGRTYEFQLLSTSTCEVSNVLTFTF